MVLRLEGELEISDLRLVMVVLLVLLRDLVLQHLDLGLQALVVVYQVCIGSHDLLHVE